MLPFILCLVIIYVELYTSTGDSDRSFFLSIGSFQIALASCMMSFSRHRGFGDSDPLPKLCESLKEGKSCNR